MNNLLGAIVVAAFALPLFALVVVNEFQHLFVEGQQKRQKAIIDAEQRQWLRKLAAEAAKRDEKLAAEAKAKARRERAQAKNGADVKMAKTKVRKIARRVRGVANDNIGLCYTGPDVA